MASRPPARSSPPCGASSASASRPSRRICGCVRAEAQRRVYALDAGPFEAVEDWLAPFRRFWDHKLDALATEVARGKKARRGTD
ncbi:MAG: putative transcriptional regulator, ArsR family [Caulobacter sp.]|nr:putative transcriptional regulator, ArsR family [Caulobacter sp.]